MMCPKSISTIAVIITAAFLLFLHPANASSEGPAITAQEALQKLKDGNLRFVASKHSQTGNNIEAVKKLAGGQNPYAIILTCSDSRVPPELLFDTGLGELFVIRVAGNVTDPIILGSIEYAAEHLGTSLIMILGHERCGAVKATVAANGKAEGNIGSIVTAIQPALQQTIDAGKITEKGSTEFVEAVADANIALVKTEMTKQSEVLKHLAEAGKLQIVAAKYDIDEGQVTIFE
jgi:carbonic anhydrase